MPKLLLDNICINILGFSLAYQPRVIFLYWAQNSSIMEYTYELIFVTLK